MTENRRDSYTAANAIPVKMFKDNELLKTINNGKLIPRHIQFLPTNKCNMNCPFCSCSERDKKLEMKIDECYKVIETFAKLGTKAVTITGGGEPLMHPHFKEIVDGFYNHGIKIGLVTNGLLIHKLDLSTYDKITWCRISSGDHRTFNNNYRRNLEQAVKKGPNIDWAFSHVVSSGFNYKTIKSVIEFANEYDFTHVRIVSDLFEPENVNLNRIKQLLDSDNVDDDIVIYQGRKEYVQGRANCWISLLKPLIGPEGMIYPCCGVQYAEKDPSKDLSDTMNMGHYTAFEDKLKNSEPFCGAVCEKCYYDEYNSTLDSLVGNELKHGEFI